MKKKDEVKNEEVKPTKQSNLLLRGFVMGAAVGLSVGIASAKKIKEMMPKIIALAANEYVKDRARGIKEKASHGWHAIAGGAGKLKDRVSTGAHSLGDKIKEHRPQEQHKQVG